MTSTFPVRFFFLLTFGLLRFIADAIVIAFSCQAWAGHSILIACLTYMVSLHGGRILETAFEPRWILLGTAVCSFLALLFFLIFSLNPLVLLLLTIAANGILQISYWRFVFHSGQSLVPSTVRLLGILFCLFSLGLYAGLVWGSSLGPELQTIDFSTILGLNTFSILVALFLLSTRFEKKAVPLKPADLSPEEFRSFAAALGVMLLAALFAYRFLIKVIGDADIVSTNWTIGGIAAGLLVGGINWHPRRSLGVGVFAVTGLAITTCCLEFHFFGSTPPLFLIPFLTGILIPIFVANFLGHLEPSYRFIGIVVLQFCFAALFCLIWLAADGFSELPIQFLWGIIALSVAFTAVAWVMLYREAAEFLLELLFLPFYRIRSYGPGSIRFPHKGPVIIVANHCAWFDPVWLGKVIPRRLFPMMTSVFFDLPVMKWLMVYVVRAIRVPHKAFRRDTPEIQEAIAVLDQGDCVMIFPEGRLRRTKEKLLHQFGQGIWLILRERPNTPVVPCWIEGSWGSFCSYDKGPPTKNKSLDILRPIRIAIQEPEILDEKILEDRSATRRYLMKRCLEARDYLGLEKIQVDNFISQDLTANETSNS